MNYILAMKLSQGWTLLEILFACCCVGIMVGMLLIQLKTYRYLHGTKHVLQSITQTMSQNARL